MANMQYFTLSTPNIRYNSNFYSISSYLDSIADTLDSVSEKLSTEMSFGKVDVIPRPTILQQTAGNDEFVLKLFAPNFTKSDIDINVEPISSDVVINMDNKKSKGLSLRLSFLSDYDIDRVKSTFSDEVLTIRIPRREAVKPRKVRIE